MSHKHMDFNPLDILAAAALGEKDAPPELKSTKSEKLSGGDLNDHTTSVVSKDDKPDSNQEMGKTTSNGLKEVSICIHTSKGMAPQKIDWSPGTFLDSMSAKSEKFTLDQLVNDIKKQHLDLEIHKLAQQTVEKEDCSKELSKGDIGDASHDDKQNDTFVSERNVINKETDQIILDTNIMAQIFTKQENDQKDFAPEDSTNSPSDLDTMDSNYSKSPDLADSASEISLSEIIALDHPYALAPGSTQLPALMDDDDIDVGSDHSPLTEETDQRSRNLSLDFNYLKSGILEGVSASTLDLYKMSNTGLGRSKLPSSSSSTSSPTADIISKSTNHIFSNDKLFKGINSGHGVSNNNSPVRPAPKYGKFRIGTYGSFSNLELEKYLRDKDLLNNRKLKIGIPPESSSNNSSFNSPSASPSAHRFLQSPSLDWDRSEASSETQDDSSDARTPLRMSPDFTEKVTEWSHPMYHDHDYCVKNDTSSPDDFSKFIPIKRKYTKRKNKGDGMNHEKFMKAKYLKKELLKQDSFIKTPPELELMATDPSVIRTNPVGRPKKRPLEKVIDEEIDPETGTKLKITGRYQDQYVYYLSKSSRTTTRRRQTPLFPHTADKIIVPAPKPGDIVVPHLTDADIETVRLKGRGALNLPARPHMTNNSPLSTAISPIQSSIPSSSHSSEFISDVDSHIVSTILSMENDNLASPTTSHAPDIGNTSGLNPNQPALTESLRLMSGDSSITSEHVLNYLLSVVKDDGLLNAASGFDGSSLSFFPSLHSDSIYSKSDHTDCSTSSVGHEIMDIGKSMQQGIGSPHDHESYDNSGVCKDHIDENGGLPDDLSSFISNSQGTSSSNTTQDGDSHGSLKSMFGSDLSSLGTPHLSSSVQHLTSIEKTLDYLVGVRDEDIKLHCGVYNTKLEDDAESDTTQPLTPLSSASSDDTPWIVTVTLYFNDVPAIMINNQPYIRLVDIHKQILPAKDTGILKKRCQLLKIPVLNCTEMQRYFLVQYGRAYNSKSTLVVSKEQANNLVTYYATPQPRIGRTEESHQRRASSGGSEGGARSPVTHLSTGIFRKRGAIKNSKKAALPSGLLGVSASVPSKSLTKNSEDVPSSSNHNKRTRHKKVNYLEMLKGEEKEKSSTASILETIESVVKSGSNCAHDGKLNKMAQKRGKDDSNCDKKSGIKKKFGLQKGTKVGTKSKKDQDIQKIKNGKGKKGSDKQSADKDIEFSSEGDSDDSLDLTQNKKFKPLKLKVNSLLNFAGQRKGSSPSKKGLFSRSNSTTSPTLDRPLRILAVAHQAALSGDNAVSHLPSQPADIHLDLFKKSNSACVRCETCSQFLSVPHFMRHHHVPMDNEWLATEAAHRILVPRNKETISDSEKLLWEEFHKLQEAIGGFGEADDETDTDEGEYEEDQGSFELSGASTSLSSMDRSLRGGLSPEEGVGTARLSPSQDDDELLTSDEDEPTVSDLPGSSVEKTQQKDSNQTLCKLGLLRRESSVSSSLSNEGHDGNHSNLRTSSRKRKSKKLFSIENYYTPKRSQYDDESLTQPEGSVTINGNGTPNVVSSPSRSRNLL
ncbi:unnamed protein product [Lymnaea stagnalis]|uniref:Putative Dachshund-homology domain-containing protein n=1 Tax=Lymnaea stagnalis TaxID=6523 RepID=A0AAV2H3H9_LYMST